MSIAKVEKKTTVAVQQFQRPQFCSNNNGVGRPSYRMF